MKILRVDMEKETAALEELPPEWQLVGGAGLIAKIMNREVPPRCDPLGKENKLIIATGPLAGTLAPQLGRISVGAKSPLTLGIKEANSGGAAAQKLDRLGIRAVVVEGEPSAGKHHCLKIDRDGARLIPAEAYRGMKNYPLADKLKQEYGDKIAIISIGPIGERKRRSASVTFTDMLGDPSRNAARGGLGAVMGAKGLKAVVIDSGGAGPMELADQELFKQTVKQWVHTLKHDVGCALFSGFGTPFAVGNSSLAGSMPAGNYSSGTPARFERVSAEVIQKNLFERGGKMHGCMPGCVVQCSIIYPGPDGKRLTSAYEYEAVAMLGTNLNIFDPDAIARLKHICDDLGIDLIETGASLAVAASGGKMEMGDEASAAALLKEIEQGSELGNALADGVVSTARFLGVKRVPAVKGQAIPGHDPRGVKGTGVTYFTSPMGADHTAGLTYRKPGSKDGQAANSLRSQVQAAACDSFGYCLNSVPGKQVSVYQFLADLSRARFGGQVSADDIVEIGKQTLKDQLAFNRQSEFYQAHGPDAGFVRSEALGPGGGTFDVEQAEIDEMWGSLDAFKVGKKAWEVRLPPIPPMLFGAGVFAQTGRAVKRLGAGKLLVVTDPVMKKLGRADQVRQMLDRAGMASALFTEVEPDPSVELVERAGAFYREQGCGGVLAIGGGSSMDTGKAVALRVSHPGPMIQYESMMGGGGRIKAGVPPIVCIPTTAGTGSDVNSCAVLTDTERNSKFIIFSDHILPALAIIDPDLCKSMPASLTAESGVDALAHCIEGYVSLSTPYMPYCESLAWYGARMVGRSLRNAYRNPDDTDARTDLSMAAAFGGIAFLKGLGIGHAIGHAVGAQHHVAHGKGVAAGLLCFVRANQEVCREAFQDLAWAIDRNTDLEQALLKLYADLNISPRLSDLGVPLEALPHIAFAASREVANISGNPAAVDERKILELLRQNEQAA